MENGIYAKFNTAKGAILVKLTHDLTPGTVGNFAGLAEGNLENKVKPQGNKYYDGLKFHRVIPDFMIQGGNSDYDKTLEMRASNSAYYITNEVQANHIHKKGAVAMAMTYTDNPEMKSAQYSYYIVIGKTFDEAVLEATEKEYKIKIPEANKSVYKSLGGTPHLDGVHTVFGEVIEGMDVVEAISKENLLMAILSLKK